MLGEVIVDHQHIFTLLHKVFAHGAAAVRRDVLQGGKLRSGGGNNDGIVHRAAGGKGFHHLGHGRALLPDGDIDTDDAVALLVQDGIQRDGGLAGLAIIRLLIAMGLDPHHVILCDRHGAIYEGRDDLNPQKEEMAKITNSGHKAGTLAEMLVDADVFIGVSAPHCVTPEMVKSMAKDPIIFAMANPTPEIMPDEALAAGAAVMGTGRSDFPNQINNVLAFPGIFRGALDVRASDINDAMKIAAAKAIADFVTPEKLSAEYIIPSPLEEGVSAAVAKAVAQAAKDTGVARV